MSNRQMATMLSEAVRVSNALDDRISACVSTQQIAIDNISDGVSPKGFNLICVIIRKLFLKIIV